nr:hemolysin family protein [Butyrivibrio sp.]
TEEEIKSMVSEGQEQGVLQETEADMITNIFEFSDKEAQDIMTNRNTMVAIDANMSLKEAVDFMMNTNNSRFPVYLDDIDHIIGIMHIRDALKKLSAETDEQLPIRKIKGLLRQPKFVPETRNIDSLFHSMQSSKTQMVVVIDEYGQTAGLVTMEDILEEIVGNIMDEYDEDENYVKPTKTAGEFIVDGKTPLEVLEKRFKITFEESEFETLNGYLISKLDRIPEEGVEFDVDVDGYNFKIQSVQNHMVQDVLLTKLPEQKVEDTENESEIAK